MNRKYLIKDFETDIYNILVLLPGEEKSKLYVRRAAFWLMKKFIKNKEYHLAAKLRDIVKQYTKTGPI